MINLLTKFCCNQLTRSISRLNGRNILPKLRLIPRRTVTKIVTNKPPYTYDVNENNYIYAYVHKKFGTNFGHSLTERAHSLPIYHLINELIEEYSMTNSDYSSIASVYTPRFLEIDFPLEPQYYNEIKQAIKGMNQQELAILLSAIQSSTSATNPVSKVVMQLIDLELKWLLKSHANTRLMDLDLWFYIADLFYESQINSSFVDVLVSYLSSNPQVSMNKNQLLHLLFLVNLKRKKAMFLTKLRDRLTSLVPVAEPDELAVICLAFFKTETPLHDKVLLNSIVQRLINLLPTIDPKNPAFCAIIKTIRFSEQIGSRPVIVELLTSTMNQKHILLASPFNTVQILRLAEAYRVYIPDLPEISSNYMVANLDDFRLKDIQFVLRNCGLYLYKPKDLDKIVEFLLKTRKEEMKRFPSLVFKILLSLSCLDHYDSEFYQLVNEEKPVELQDIDKLSRQTMLRLYVYTRMYAHDVNLADFFSVENLRKACQELRRPGSLGLLRLNDSLSSLKYIIEAVPESNARSNRLNFVYEFLKKQYGDQVDEIKITQQYTLAHQCYPDIIITHDDAPGHFDSHSLLPKLTPSESAPIVLLEIIWEKDTVDNISRPRGSIQLDTKTKRNLGYKVLSLPWYSVFSFDFRHVSITLKPQIDSLLNTPYRALAKHSDTTTTTINNLI